MRKLEIPIALFTLTFAASSFVKMTPTLFAPEVISTQDDELNGSFTPDGREYFFTKKNPTTQRSSSIRICSSRLVDGKWTIPTLAPFSGPYKDLNPFISNDGSRLYYISTRPVDEKPKVDADIWFMEKDGIGWGRPENLGAPINSEFYEQSVSVANNGTLYFSSTRDRRSLDIYKSTVVNGVYQEPENLGEAINSPDYNEQDVFIAPDESYLLFSCLGRPDGINAKSGAQYPRSDLYIAYWRNGQWSKAVNMGPDVNSEADESSPSVSRDGRTLYFTSERNFAANLKQRKITYPELVRSLRSPGNGLGDIYSVAFEHNKP